MVRWVVAGEVFTETFASFKLADGFRSRLIQAINRAEEFDVATGLPVAMLEAQEQEASADLSWLQFCKDYVAARWDEVAPKTRESICDSLATATQVMVEARSDRPAPRDLRRAFLWAVLPANADAEPPKDIHDDLIWLDAHSQPLKALADPQLVRKAIHQLGQDLRRQASSGGHLPSPSPRPERRARVRRRIGQVGRQPAEASEDQEGSRRRPGRPARSRHPRPGHASCSPRCLTSAPGTAPAAAAWSPSSRSCTTQAFARQKPSR